MGARKGQNNFGRHQAKAVSDRLRDVSTVLKAIGRQQSFGSFGALSRYVALAVGVDPTTMSRNQRYRKAVWDAVIARPGLVTDASGEVAPAAALQAGRLASEIEAAGLRRENQRLRRFHERTGAPEPSTDPAIPAPTAPAGSPRDFEDTALVLLRLLRHLAAKDLGIGIDPATGAIRDAGEVGDAGLVAGSPETKAFLDWASRHRLFEGG